MSLAGRSRLRIAKLRGCSPFLAFACTRSKNRSSSSFTFSGTSSGSKCATRGRRCTSTSGRYRGYVSARRGADGSSAPPIYNTGQVIRPNCCVQFRVPLTREAAAHALGSLANSVFNMRANLGRVMVKRIWCKIFRYHRFYKRRHALSPNSIGITKKCCPARIGMIAVRRDQPES
jgi:hypothetical protein